MASSDLYQAPTTGKITLGNGPKTMA